MVRGQFKSAKIPAPLSSSATQGPGGAAGTASSGLRHLSLIKSCTVTVLKKIISCFLFKLCISLKMLNGCYIPAFIPDAFYESVLPSSFALTSWLQQRIRGMT